MKLLTKIGIPLVVLVILLVPLRSHAVAEVENYILLQPITVVQPTDPARRGEGLAQPTAVQYIQRIYYFALSVAVILAILMLVIAGAEYAAAGVSPSSKEDAKKRIQYALGGLVLALSSYLILQTVNPQIFNTSISITKIPSSAVGAGGGGGGGGGTAPGVHTRFMQNILRASCVSFSNSGVSLEGIPPSAIQSVSMLGMLTGNDSVIITAGTNGNHDEHGPNLPVLDLRETIRLKNTFGRGLESTCTDPICPTLSDGSTRPTADSSGNYTFTNGTTFQFLNGTYTYESRPNSPGYTGPHFHVRYEGTTIYGDTTHMYCGDTTGTRTPIFPPTP